MYTLSVSVDVNPDGATPLLTQAQVWRGLVMKAENAVLFVPSMKSCEVLERHAGGLLREVVNGPHRFREEITFTPEVQVLFERVGTVENAGWITNVISESEHGLLLTFTFSVNLPGVEPGTPAERQRGEEMRDSYVGAVKATLARVRQLVTEGTLSP
ncbi:MAG: hypothetical protein JWL84_4439 [Rhodospirillales bacterium]|jgi:hypothetical protein|nr:hypothetical protein [Rhodospirillales bacterium]